MKAFLSYSLNDKDQFILTLLSSELRKKGFVVKQSNDFQTEMSSITKVNIINSQIFIGIISGKGKEKKRVLKELRLSKTSNVPNLLLIENTVKVPSDFKHSYIYFDRLNPEIAISELKKRLKPKERLQTSHSNAWAWALGGAALIAVIGLLASDD